MLLSIFAFVDFVTQLNSVGTGDYGAMQAVVYILLRVPQRLYELSPSILLLGGILSLGALAANSELIVMRASGITVSRITRSVMQAGFIIAVFVALLGEFIAPSAIRMAKTYRAEAMEEKLILGGTRDIWARDGNRYVNVKEIMPDHQLRQVRVFELDDDKQLGSITYAEKAMHQDNEWVLNGIKRSILTSEGVTTEFKEQIKLDRLILLELFSVLELDSKDMSAIELFKYSRYLENNHLDNDEFLLEFWIKVITPFTCLAMLLIALPVVFSTTPRSGGVGQRVILAVVIGIVYFVINRSINHIGLAINIAPFISAIVPLLLVLSVSVFFLRRVK